MPIVGDLRSVTGRLVATALCVSVVGMPTLVASAASASVPIAAPGPAPDPAPSPTPTDATGSGGGPGELQPSAEQLAAQARADALHDQLREQAGATEQARAALADASRAAAAALERYRAAVLAQQQAQLDAATALATLQRAQKGVDDQRRALGRWAWQVYTDGGTLQQSPALVTLLDGGSTDDLGVTAALMQSVGDGQARTLEALRTAQRAQEAALESAAVAQERADAGAAEATAARDAADAAVARHRAALDAATRAYQATSAAAAEADRQAELLAAAGSWQGGPGSTVPLGEVGDCGGGDIGAYPNGRIPVALLCPLPAAPGKYLRADAAYAFARMSAAFAAAFGRPICVTSAYRSYEDQVRVAAERPGFAAKPGSSNHGWGTATDLCGGIDRFDTPTHTWMLANAPLFGWFHPAWARATGTLPEPWHWEFGG